MPRPAATGCRRALRRIGWRRAALLPARSPAAAGADRPRRPARLLGDGARGEVVAELLPEFERAIPASGRGAAAALDGGAREAADRVRRRRHCPTSASSATPGCRSSARSTRSSRSTSGWPRRRHRRATTTSPASSDTNVMPAARRTAARRAVVRRHAPALLPHATCCAPPAIARPPQTWAEWHAAMLAAIRQRGGGRTATAIAAAAQRVRAAVRAGAAAGRPLLRDGGRPRQFLAAAASGARSTSTSSIFRDGLRAAAGATPDRPTSGTSSAAACSRSTSSGPWNIGEFRRRLPAERQDDWTTAPLPGPDGPGVSIAGGSSLVDLPRSRAQGRGLAADRVPVASPRRCSASTRSPATCRRGAAPGERRRSPTTSTLAGVSRAARARARRAQDARVGAHRQEMQLVAERVVHGPARSRRPPPRARRARRSRCSRSAAGCSRAGARTMKRGARRLVLRRAGARS